jgi:hypothetical protein
VPARFLGRADLGVLEPGAPRDVVVLDDRLEIRPSSARADAMSWLETELREQPEALRGCSSGRARRRADAAALPRATVRYILIASRGSSSNVARYAQYLLGRAHSVPVMFATPSLYTIYGQPPRLDGAVVIGISQSGASPDVVRGARARRGGRAGRRSRSRTPPTRGSPTRPTRCCCSKRGRSVRSRRPRRI